MLVRDPLSPRDVDRLDLGRNRAAHRVILDLPAGRSLLVCAVHLHHIPADEAVRAEQAATLVAWLASAPPTDAVVVMGDFNAEPDEPTYARMTAAGFRSAMAEANGTDPAVTWPSGLQAPAMDTDGPPGCLDYIWIRGAARVEQARLVFDRPHPDDPTLYPSDHVGLSAHLEIG